MNNTHLNECSIFTHPFRVTARNVEDIIHTAPELASLKDTNEKYLITNQHETKFSGFTPDEFYGLTLEDINQRARFINGPKHGFIDTIKKLDYQVATNKLPIFMKEIYVTQSGFIRVGNLIKLPILGHDNKTIAIFAYCQDQTLQLNLFDLFSLYRKAHSPKESITKLLDYFNARKYFQEMLTRTEVLIIIAMSLDHRHKAVSQLLKKTLRTVSSHSFSINQKLKSGFNIHDVVAKIRNAGKNKFSIANWPIGQSL